MQTAEVISSEGRKYRQWVKNGLHSDFILVSNSGERFNVHRVFLAARSDFMRNHFKEWSCNELHVDVPSLVIKCLIEYIYCDVVNFPEAFDLIQPLMNIAELWQLNPLCYHLHRRFLHKTRDKQQFSSIDKEIYAFYQSNSAEDLFPDVILHSESEVFHAHKVILATHSNYFRSLFSGGWGDLKPRDGIPTLQIFNFSEGLLDFFYSGQVDLEKETVNYVIELIKLSHYFAVESLVDICEEKLISEISYDTYSILWQMASEYMLSDLQTATVKFLEENFSYCAAQPNFLSLTNKEIIVASLHSGNIDMESEPLQTIVMKWVKANNYKTPEEFFPPNVLFNQETKNFIWGTAFSWDRLIN